MQNIKGFNNESSNPIKLLKRKLTEKRRKKEANNHAFKMTGVSQGKYMKSS